LNKPFNITVLISGGGSNLQAIINAIDAGLLPTVCINKVIADRPSKGLQRAQKHGISTSLVDRKINKNRLDEAILEAIPSNTHYIVMAGYLSIVGETIINAYKHRIINIHPALLPKYGGKGMYGMNVHRAVVKNLEKESGCTVHLVDTGIDTGQSLFQRTVPVVATDKAEDVQQRVLEQEHIILPKAIHYLSLLHQAGLKNKALEAGKPISDSFLAKGITNFYGACHHVKNLPFHRNSKRDFSCVLPEGRGVCSTKHALLSSLANELKMDEVELILGIYKMDGKNTVGVGSVLEAAGMAYIPEAHSYLRVNNIVLDFTRSESFTAESKYP